jgi:hypothetical protein
MRTSVNQTKFLAEDIKAGNKELAARRLLGMSIATSASYALSVLSMQLMGISGDDDEAVRLLGPEWQRNSQLLYTGYDENGMPTYMDLSYYDPYTYIKKPISALLSGNNKGFEKKAGDALSEFAEPFIGADIAAGAMMELWSNRKATGGKIYNPEDSVDDIAFDMMNHFRKAVQPGIVSNIERISKAARGHTSLSGKEYTLRDEALALAGFRAGTLNIPQSMYYRGLEFKDRKVDSQRILSKTLNSPNEISDKEIKTSFDSMIKARKAAYMDMIKIVEASFNLGATKREVYSVLKAAGMSDNDIAYLIKGKVPKWVPSKSYMDSQMEKAMATMEKGKGRERAKELRDRVRYVYRLIKEQ